MFRTHASQNQRFSASYSLITELAEHSGRKARFIWMIIWMLLKSKVKLLCLLPLLMTSWQLHATDNTSLHGVNILVTEQAKDVRKKAFQDGLDEMFIRISGDSAVMDKLQRPDSQLYVRRFSYEPLAKPVTNSKGESLTQRIKIQYNVDLVEKYLRDAGLAVWGERRADVVVWLAVRDGKREYVLKNADRSLIKTSLSRALQRRGIPEQWPVYDSEDKAIVSAVDIRGGFKGPLLVASKRYSRGPVLSGSLNWNGKIWQSSWELFTESDDQQWSFNNKSYKQLINLAVDQVADAMGTVFAVRDAGGSRQFSIIHVGIEAINSVVKYNRAEKYLTSLSAVEAVNPIHTDGDKTLFEVVLRSSEAAFLSLVKNDAVFLEVTKTVGLSPAGKAQTQPVPLAGNLPSTSPGMLQTTALPAPQVLTAPEVIPAHQVQDSATQIPVHHYRFIN